MGSKFQKHAFLSDGNVDQEAKVESRSRTASPLKSKAMSQSLSRLDQRKRRNEEPVKVVNKNYRSACHDPSIAPEDLVMLGLYRLDETQQEIYRSFVDMVSGFDDFDKVCFDRLRWTSASH